MPFFSVALSSGFRKSNGTPSFPEFDLSPLESVVWRNRLTTYRELFG